MGVWAAIAVGGGAVGLVLGGILVEALSWPWIFFVNVPVGIAVFVAALRNVPESSDEHAHKSFDIAGAVTVTAGLVALVYGIVKAQEKGWTSLHTGGFFALSVMLLGRSSSSRAARPSRSCACRFSGSAPFAPPTS